ncbi:MAG: hypothetical protein AB1390_00290, partial [Nitrospirota bacterium]
MKKFPLRMRYGRDIAESGIVLILLSVTAFFYYRDIFDFWFVSDDAAAIVSSTASLKEILLNRIYSNFFYTPLVALSFKPDVLLFGLNPLPYHIHNAVILVLTSFMVYRILRLYTDRISSSLAAIIVLLAVPSLICLLWITLRQYLYAMLFALLSVYLFLKNKPNPKNNPFMVLIILVFSELSFMGKEQYMTLPFVLFILAGGNFRQRFSMTYPYFLLLVGHFFLRLYVLEGIGGYPGFHYGPLIYAKAVYRSIFIESKVLFNYNWPVIPLAFPLLLRPKKLLLSVLLWFFALSVSFVVMSDYPQLDTYRYWFIPTVLFAVMLGLNANSIRNRYMKIAGCATVIAFFLIHSFSAGYSVIAFFEKECQLAESVTRAILDKKYKDSLILFPDSSWLPNSGFIGHMSEAYYRVDGIRSHFPFFPLELLSFYPEVSCDFTDIYEIKGDRIEKITGSIEDRINLFRRALSS